MSNRRMLRFVVAALLLIALAVAVLASLKPAGADEPFRVGFGSRAITPVGEPPAEWKPYFTPHPVTGVWGEPFADLDGDGCMSGITNHNLEPLLDAEPPRGQTPEPHIDQPWNSLGDAYRPERSAFAG